MWPRLRATLIMRWRPTSEPLRSDRFQYTPGKSLGSPDPTSFKGDTETGDGHAMTEALEQIAFELRTANLIARRDPENRSAPAAAWIIARRGVCQAGDSGTKEGGPVTAAAKDRVTLQGLRCADCTSAVPWPTCAH